MIEKIWLIATIIFFAVSLINATDCPYGYIDEEYPGTCPRYIDYDNNNICDLSQVEEEMEESHDLITGKDLKTKTVEEIAHIYNINSHEYAHSLSNYYNVKIEPWDEFQTLHDNIGLEPNIAKDIALNLQTGEEMIVASSNHESKYEIIFLSLFLFLLYLLTYTANKAKIINYKTHKKIWNIVLLISFLFSGILGILLVIRINYQIQFDLFFNILYWHVEAGIVMAIVSIIHIIERIKYFKNILK